MYKCNCLAFVYNCLVRKESSMKKIIRWLARVFNAEITIEKIVEKEKVVYKPLNTNEPLFGTVYVEGDLIVDGRILVTGDVVCKTLEVESSKQQ